jgi:hypothetical protein
MENSSPSYEVYPGRTFVDNGRGHVQWSWRRIGRTSYTVAGFDSLAACIASLHSRGALNGRPTFQITFEAPDLPVPMAMVSRKVGDGNWLLAARQSG